MNLYRISQGDNNSYDTYDSAVVAAESEDRAKLIHPNDRESKSPYGWNPESNKWESSYFYNGEPRKYADYHSWANSPQGVDVEFIGTAVEGTEEGVICASFNAG